MNQAVTQLGAGAVNSIREVQKYSTGFFTNTFSILFMLAVIVLLQ